MPETWQACKVSVMEYSLCLSIMSRRTPPLQGWSEEQADEMQALAKAEVVNSNVLATVFDTAKKHTPTGHVRLHTPPRLEKHLTQALRAAAVRAFQVPLLPAGSSRHTIARPSVRGKCLCLSGLQLPGCLPD